jgi:hypothetical protein
VRDTVAVLVAERVGWDPADAGAHGTPLSSRLTDPHPEQKGRLTADDKERPSPQGLQDALQAIGLLGGWGFISRRI